MRNCLIRNIVTLLAFLFIFSINSCSSFQAKSNSEFLCRKLKSCHTNSLNKSFKPNLINPSLVAEMASPNKLFGVFKNKGFKVFFYISMWYFISIFYNIYNKKALNLLKLPWFVATSQMGAGLLMVFPLWLLRFRKWPGDDLETTKIIFRQLTPVALYQTLTHISGVIALGSGSVSFVQVVKASEPAFTAFTSAVFERQYFSLPVYLTLIPVIVGVAMASATELTFTWYCFYAGIMANIFAAARGVFGKKQMCGDVVCVEAMSPENYYSVLTIVSFLMLVPMTIVAEGPKILSVLSQYKTSQDIHSGLGYTFLSGIMFYLYNELSFVALNDIHPVSHALANTVKRIVIILSSFLVFRNEIKPLGIAGTVISIFGVFAYSLAQYYTKKKPSTKN